MSVSGQKGTTLEPTHWSENVWLVDAFTTSSLGSIIDTSIPVFRSASRISAFASQIFTRFAFSDCIRRTEVLAGGRLLPNCPQFTPTSPDISPPVSQSKFSEINNHFDMPNAIQDLKCKTKHTLDTNTQKFWKENDLLDMENEIKNKMNREITAMAIA